RNPGLIPVMGSNGRNGWHDTARAPGPGVTVLRSGASAGVITFVAGPYWPHNTVLFVRVCPGTSCGITELSQHEADGGEAQEGKRLAVEAFPILGQSAAATEPGQGAFDDPALGQGDEAFRLIRPFDDLDVDARQNAFHRALELRPLVAGVGVELDQERKGAEQARHQQRAAVAVLEVGGVHDRVHQQALGIDEDVPLLALDLLARVVARRIDAGPPFSALLTLWLSMMAAVGLASREAAARHRT